MTHSRTKPAPNRRLELALEGIVCGVDEVGYSPLAGPVVAAAVVFDASPRPRELAGLRDSKQLSRQQREHYFDIIVSGADVGLGQASVMEIDSLNIYQANKLAMARAVGALSGVPDIALVDGHFKPDLPCPIKGVVKGDEKCFNIAAASIVAKVSRDRLMAELAGEYPGFGWDSNFGYGTETHYLGLLRLGPNRHHRRSFAPVRTWLADSAILGTFRFEPVPVVAVSLGELFELRRGLIGVFDESRRHIGTLVLGGQGWRFRAMGYERLGCGPTIATGPLAPWHNSIVDSPTIHALNECISRVAQP